MQGSKLQPAPCRNNPLNVHIVTFMQKASAQGKAASKGAKVSGKADGKGKSAIIVYHRDRDLSVNEVLDILRVTPDDILAVTREFKFDMDMVANFMYRCPRRDQLGYKQEGATEDLREVLKHVVKKALRDEQQTPEGKSPKASRGKGISRQTPQRQISEVGVSYGWQRQVKKLKNQPFKKADLEHDMLRRWCKIVEKDKYKHLLQECNNLPEAYRKDYRESVIICQQNGSLDEFL